MTTPPPTSPPPNEPRVPTLDEVVERYREGKNTIAAIAEFPPDGDAREREQLVIRAYLTTSKVIEGAIYYQAAKVLKGIANPAALNFFDALDKLSKPLRLPPDWVSELRILRKMRNSIEHGGGVMPRLSALNEVLRHAERLLLEVLHVARELVDPDPPRITPPERNNTAPWSSLFEALAAPMDRSPLLDQAVNDGVTRLREGKRLGEALTTTLQSDARSLVTLAARGLWGARLGPGAAIPEYEPVNDFLRLETELMDVARSGKTLDPAKLRLHVRRVGLCEEAGWLVRHQGKLRFANELVPALALGAGLTPNRKTVGEVLEIMAVHPVWGLSLQGAIHQTPATAGSWLDLLRRREDSSTLLAEVVAHALILGVLPADTAIGDAELAASRDFALHGIILLGPRRDTSLAWALPPPTFWSCVLSLASASTVLRERLPADLGPVPPRLARLVADLEIEPALASDEAEAVTAFAMPWHALRAGRLTSALSVTVQAFYARAPIEAHPLFPWVSSIFAPAALEHDAVGLLCDLEHGSFGALLVQTSKIRPVWIEAWSRILRRDPKRAIAIWVGVLRDQLAPTAGFGVWATELLQPVLARLRAATLEDAAKDVVRSELLTWSFPDQSTDNHRALFKWADLRSEDWAAGLKHWKTQTSLSWALLRDCGAPQAVLARWALHFLKERESVPPALRDGPVGIGASSNLRVTQAGPWKAAFNEARECTDWLLGHGDKGALHVIADAALAPDAECNIPYFYLEQVRLWLSLGQVFWRRVLARTEGRNVLYERLAEGKYIGIHCWPNFDWQLVIDAVSRDEALVVREAPKIFEAYVRYCSVEWQPTFVRRDQPWEHPPANISVDWHSGMLMLAAWQGIFVLDEWRRVVIRYREAMSYYGGNLAAVYSRLAEQHPDAVANASGALSDDLLTALCVDGTEAFWEAWLDDVGLEFFRKRVEALGVQDLGAGVITTMLERDRTALAERLAEPRYFTPFLRVARDPAIYGDVNLRKILWEKPREVADLEPLINEPRGPWLDALVEFSATWPLGSRRAALVALARRAVDPEVRQRCLGALASGPGGEEQHGV